MPASTSRDAEAILRACLAGQPWPPAALRRLVEAGDPALFSTVVEGLADRFEPRLAEAYAGLFAQVIAWALPEFSAAELRARYERVRRPRRLGGKVHTVFVLSRVTLGADIAVASVMLDAARRRFPQARIVLVGGAKSRDLFAADPRIDHLDAAYGRASSLTDRLQAGLALRGRLDGVVIDPDSRLTQLGLLPVCAEQDYYFFDSRSHPGAGSLAALAARWAEETLGVSGAGPYLALKPVAGVEAPAVTVSLGVGENPAKRLPDPFEARLLEALAGRFPSVLVDTGAGGEEAERVARAIGGRRIAAFRGSFAEFAARIARSRLYVGYDSAGQHAAAALGVPVVTVFAGYPCPRFVERWSPAGAAPVEIVCAEGLAPEAALARTLEAVTRCSAPGR